MATETAFEKKRAVAEGRGNIEVASSKKVKVATTGIRGVGASAIFYKHLRESFRANRLGLWNLSSVVIILGAALFAIFLRMDGPGKSVILLQTLMWGQILMIGMGRGMKELYAHHIYMIPESPFAKIVWSNLEVVLKVLVESLLAFGIAGVILRESPLVIAAVIVVYTLFSLLLIGINYLSLRWTGADMSVGILMLIYMLAVVIIMLPGLIPALIVGSMIEGWGALADF